MTEGVFHVIVPPDDMGDLLGDVVAHVGKMEYGAPVASDDDEILEDDDEE